MVSSFELFFCVSFRHPSYKTQGYRVYVKSRIENQKKPLVDFTILRQNKMRNKNKSSKQAFKCKKPLPPITAPC